LENCEEGITDVVMKGRFETFGKATGEKVISVAIARFVAKGA
jgi:hypothetical protein